MSNGLTVTGKLKFLLTIALLVPNLALATTVTLDWSTVSFTGHSQSYDIDSSNTGSDVTMTITPSSGASASAAVVANPLNGGQKDLAVSVWGTDTASVTVRFDFHYTGGVSDVSVPVSGVQMLNGTAPTEITNLYGQVGSTKFAGSFSVPGNDSGVSVMGAGLSASLYGVGPAASSNSNATINMLSGVTALQFNFGTPEGGAFGANTLYLGPLMYIDGNPLTAGDAANQTGFGPPLDISGNPEPMTFLLLGSGLAAIGFARYRSRKTSA